MTTQAAGAAQVVATLGDSGYTINIVTSGKHTLLADEPTSLGGADAGPNPYDLLLASLASCKLITLRMYAERKGWPLEGAHVRLSQRSVHASDCDGCEKNGEMIHEISGELVLIGDLSDEQRERMREIADRCPVHRTLTSEIRIATRLAQS